MTLRPTTRSLFAATFATLLLATATLHAQRGMGGMGGGARANTQSPQGGGQGPGGSGGQGGMMGGPSRNGMGGNMGNPRGHSFDTPIEPPLKHGLHIAPPGRWWDDKKTVKHLSLRSDQQKKMDDIFETNRATLIGLYSNLQREEAKLNTLSSSDLQDETKVFAAIDRVAQARADLEKSAAHIELQIRQQLDPTQLATLDQDIAIPR